MRSKICIYGASTLVVLAILVFLIAPIYEVDAIETLRNTIPIRYYLSLQTALVFLIFGYIVFRSIRKPSSSSFSLTAFHTFLVLSAVVSVGPVSCSPKMLKVEGEVELNESTTGLLDLFVYFGDITTSSIWPTIVTLLATILFGFLYWGEKFSKDKFASWLFNTRR